jgi:hypothetical protein
MTSKSRIPMTYRLNADVDQQPWRRAFYSIEQIKELASISRTTIYREAQAGRLKLSKLAGRTGAMDENFMAWLALGKEIKRSPTGTTESADSGHTAPRPRKPSARHLPPPPRRGLPTGEVNAPGTSQGALRRSLGVKA